VINHTKTRIFAIAQYNLL